MLSKSITKSLIKWICACFLLTLERVTKNASKRVNFLVELRFRLRLERVFKNGSKWITEIAHLIIEAICIDCWVHLAKWHLSLECRLVRNDRLCWYWDSLLWLLLVRLYVLEKRVKIWFTEWITLRFLCSYDWFNWCKALNWGHSGHRRVCDLT